MNLVIGVIFLIFNFIIEILVIVLEKMKEVVRLVYFFFCIVFLNFLVVKKKNIFYVYIMDFFLRSGYFVLGNEKGKVLMYRLYYYLDF